MLSRRKQNRKQEITIADSTDNCFLTVWENFIDCLKLCDCYYLTKLLVRIFNGDYYLSRPAFGSDLVEIGDIGEVKEVCAESMEPIVEGAKIVAVKELNCFKVCISCKGKVEIDEECNDIGTCQKSHHAKVGCMSEQ